MEGQSLKSHCSAAAGFLPKSGGGGGRRRSSFSSSSSSSSCWIPPRFLRHPKRTGGSCISVVEIRTPPLRSLPALSLQQQQQEFVNIVEGNDDDASSSEEKKKKKKNIDDDDDDDEMVRSSGGGRRRRRSSSSSSVHVKFVLHKECSFGEKFFLVGDDPMFGLWDLQKAIPLNWSEGHFWTAEMDLPLEKSSIQFKFILGDASSGSGGEFHWQPGPDRVLHIWDTPNTIVVTEDWDKADNQKLTEEEEEEDQPPPPLLMQQQLMMITNQDGDGDGGDNVQQLLTCGLTSINPPPSPPVSAEAEAEPPIAVFPNDDDDVVENESKPLDNIMFTSEKANELLECYSSQSRPSS